MSNDTQCTHTKCSVCVCLCISTWWITQERNKNAVANWISAAATRKQKQKSVERKMQPNNRTFGLIKSLWRTRSKKKKKTHRIYNFTCWNMTERVHAIYAQREMTKEMGVAPESHNRNWKKKTCTDLNWQVKKLCTQNIVLATTRTHDLTELVVGRKQNR